MNKNYYVIFTGIFLGLCLLLCGGIWFAISTLSEYRAEYDQLDAERHNNTNSIANLEARNANLSKILNLSIKSAGSVPDAVTFLSMVRRLLDTHHINLLYVATSGQDNSGKKDNIVKIKMDGNYYDIAKMFADLRELPAASKITSLSLKRNHDLPEELVEADLTIEVMTEE